ncbi:MAG TPA: C4-type zinc ribbon domain-containing protein [Fredinandcohnia sp.]|nr:C4-type zinc ribbon domain-containing protein [Fredinandcohnia sp.]
MEGSSTLHDLLKALNALQSVDTELDELVRKSREYPNQLAELDARLGAAREATDACRRKLEELQAQKRALEEQLAADKEKIKKWEARLTEQRSAREYAALAREIDIAKKQNATASEEIVELAQAIQAAAEELEAAEKAFAEIEAEVSADRARIEAALGETSEKEAALSQRRMEAAKSVPAQMLRRYDLIHQRRGTVLVPVVNGACSGCRMSIPPQLLNQLLARPKLDACPTCGRMIYVPSAFEREQPEA